MSEVEGVWDFGVSGFVLWTVWTTYTIEDSGEMIIVEAWLVNHVV